METITGTVNKLIYESQQNDFKVFMLKKKDRSVIRITGDFPQVVYGAKIELHGAFNTHPKYGLAFKADAHTYSYEKTTESLCLYIQSIAKWVGPQRSYAIAEKFGETLEEIIEKTPERLIEIDGIGEKVALSIADAWKLNANMKDIQVFLHGLGLGIAKIKRIITMFGAETKSILTENPWILCGHGFGFTTCDHIANKLGRNMRDSFRYKQFVLYTLRMVSSSGHLFLFPSQLLAAFNKYNSKSDYPFKGGEITLEEIAPHVRELVHNAELINDNNRIYELSSFFFENESARLIIKMFETKSSCKLNADLSEKFITRYEKQNTTDESKPFKLSDMQADAIRSFFTEKVMIITGPPGSGKCLGKDTPVMMYDGNTKLVQDIKVGDLLMGDDSSPREVLSIARGTDQLYRVIPVKGDSYVVNSNHILSLKESPCGKGQFIKGRVRDVSLQKYLKYSKFTKHHLKGYRVPIDFSDKEIPIDPYILGFWLGNGANEGPRISTSFKEVVEYIDSLVQPMGLSVKKVKGDNVDYDITCDRDSEAYDLLDDKRYPNSIRTALKDLNLIDNKHIPDIYKKNNREIRLRLLAGIIDSDGYSDKKMDFDLLFTNKLLSEDIVYVARSLGFSAYIKECEKSYNCERKGKRYKGKVKAYRFNISGDGLSDIPVVALKRRILNRKQKKDVLVTGIKIVPENIGEYYGFEISGNGRFLLGDFTVTHNTTVLKAFVQILKENGISFELLAPTGIAAKKLGNTAGHEAYTIHRRLGYKGDRWDYNNSNKYTTDVAIIDEGSMVDQEVFYRTISALYSSTKIVFVGDNDQLPSVGPGSVLKELIDSKIFKTIFLNKIFRQEKTSEIILEAKKIRDGDTDLTYFRSEKEADIWHISDRDEKRIENLIIRFAQQLKNTAKDKKKISFQIISPRNTGFLSVESLNKVLQSCINPKDINKKEISLTDQYIRVGDRIIIKKNNYELGIFNGDIGKIIAITYNTIVMDIEDSFNSQKRVELPIKLAEEFLKLAYCITVHKCIPLNSYVLTNSGFTEYKQLKENNRVVTDTLDNKKIIFKSKTIIKKGNKIKTERGYCTSSSQDHAFLIADTHGMRYLKAKDINNGQYACIVRKKIEGKSRTLKFTQNNHINRHKIETPNQITEDLSWLVGALIGDGWYNNTEDGRIEYASPDNPELLYEMKKILKGYKVNSIIKYKKGIECTLSVCNKNFRDFLEYIGLEYVTGTNKDIPKIFLQESIINRSHLLSGLFDTDGSVYKNKRKIKYNTISKNIVSKIQLILLSLGIGCTTTFYPNVGYNKKGFLYTISIVGEDVLLLSKIIQFRSNKKKILNSKIIENTRRNTSYNRIPFGKKICRLFLEQYYEKNIKVKGPQKIKKGLNRYKGINNTIHSILCGQRYLTTFTLKKLLDIAIENKLSIAHSIKNIIKRNYIFDKITNIEPIEETPMGDIEVKDDNSYCVDGFVCHNSQGSEYSIVILPLIKAHGNLLLQRNLLYTAITRAKKKVVLIGQTSAIEQAINNDKIQKRNTLLAERVNQWTTGTGISLRNMFSHSSVSQDNRLLEQLLSLEEGSS